MFYVTQQLALPKSHDTVQTHVYTCLPVQKAMVPPVHPEMAAEAILKTLHSGAFFTFSCKQTNKRQQKFAELQFTD